MASSDQPSADADGFASRKRRRDDEEGADQERIVRVSTDKYKPPVGVSLWDGITRPIRSFFEGFK